MLSTAGSTSSEVPCVAALVSLSASEVGRQLCVRERATSLLVLLSKSLRKPTVLRVVGAMAIMSKHVDLRPSMVDVGTLNVLICMILTGGQHLEDIKIDCVRTLCQLTCSQDLHEVLIHKRIIVAIVVLTNKRGLVPSTVVDHLAAHALCNLSRSKMSHRSLVEDGGTELLVALILRSQPITPSSVDLSCVVLDSVNALARVGASALMVGALLASGLVEALSSLSPRQLVDPRLSLCASQALAALSRSAAHRRDLVARGITTALIGLVRESPTPQAKLLCAEAFRNLSMENSTRASMVACGVERVLVDLGAILDDRDTEAHCAAALANLFNRKASFKFFWTPGEKHNTLPQSNRKTPRFRMTRAATRQI